MEVYFIRHTAVDVESGTVYGQTDVPLKESFESEAEVVKQELDTIEFDYSYVSPLSRCRKLADYCGFSHAEVDKRILELNFGEWEMKKLGEINDPLLRDWYDDYLSIRIPGGESFSDQFERVSDFIRELREKSFKKVAVFTHGGVIACVKVFYGMIKPEEALSSQTPFGGILKIAEL